MTSDAAQYAPHPSVGLLYDSLSRNTGDIAIGLALQQVLATRGIATEVVNPFHVGPEDPRPLVVGGGELIRPVGDDFYDSFRPRGQHVLNAAGVWPNADDLDYLSDYAFVSARSQAEVAVLEKYVDDVHLVPCLTTLLESEPYPIDGLEAGEPVVGIHVVPHTVMMCPDLVSVIDDLPYKKVFIPFTHYNFDRDFMARLKFDMSNAILLDELKPLELHSVMGQMKFNVVSSLHASIFSYSHNVPFATVQQVKVRDYFTDRGLQGQVFASSTDLRNILETYEAHAPDYTALLDSDRQALTKVIDAIEQRAVEVLGHGPARRPSPTQRRSAQVKTDRLFHDQLRNVVAGRDVVIETLMDSQRELVDRQAELVDEANFELDQLQAELHSVRYHAARRFEAAKHESRVLFIEAREARAELEAITRTKSFRVLRLPRRIYELMRTLSSLKRR